jgi:hypothetical protein
VFAVVPLAVPGVAQTIEQRLAALLQWAPPPPAPKSVTDAMVPNEVTVASAQRLVHFQIVPPVGLPHDAGSPKIFLTPTGAYDKSAHTWSVGPPNLTFKYRRANGREFALSAGAYDPARPQPKYMFDGDELGPNGLPKRHEHFTWRNGDQSMSATEGDGLSAREIRAIVAAMHGTAQHPATSRSELNSGKTNVMNRLP